MLVLLLSKSDAKKLSEGQDKMLKKQEEMSETLKKILAVLEKQYGSLQPDSENPPAKRDQS